MGITPTVGRKVWYYEDATQQEPFDGTVVRVLHSETEPDNENTPCNIFVIEPGGFTRLVPNIKVGEEGVNIPHFRWMPYQQAQAAAQANVPTTPTETKL